MVIVLMVGLALSAMWARPIMAATETQCAEILQHALEDKNPDTRQQAVVALSLVGTREPFLSRLESMLQDDDVEVRLATVAGLAEVNNKRAIATLRAGLKDAVPEVSFAAAKALWGLRDPAGKRALMAMLEGESKASSGFFSTRKRDALRMMHTPRTLFLSLLRRGAGFAPVPGLGEGVASLQALLTDPGTSNRAAAALMLAKDTAPATLAALTDALKDKDWSVRAAAVHALALRNDPAIKDALAPLLEDEKQAVRLRAAAGYLRLSAIEDKRSAR